MSVEVTVKDAHYLNDKGTETLFKSYMMTPDAELTSAERSTFEGLKKLIAEAKAAEKAAQEALKQPRPLPNLPSRAISITAPQSSSPSATRTTPPPRSSSTATIPTPQPEAPSRLATLLTLPPLDSSLIKDLRAISAALMVAGTVLLAASLILGFTIGIVLSALLLVGGAAVGGYKVYTHFTADAVPTNK